MTKVLVSYFSASGVTAGVAKELAGSIGADLYEIEPEVTYTEADLDWRDQNSRSSVEMKDRSSRPAIRKTLQDPDSYDVIFVGFPIWWYREPSVIDTFVETYGFAGKKIVPFATSGSSDMGESTKSIGSVVPSADVREGRRFPSDASASDLKAWAEKFI